MGGKWGRMKVCGKCLRNLTTSAFRGQRYCPQCQRAYRQERYRAEQADKPPKGKGVRYRHMGDTETAFDKPAPSDGCTIAGIRMRTIAADRFPSAFVDSLTPILETLKHALLQRGLRPMAMEFEHLAEDDGVPYGFCSACHMRAPRADMIRQADDVREYHLQCYARNYRLE